MALIICPECNKELSEYAKTCPHCGYKLPKAKKVLSSREKKKRAVIFIGVFLVLIALGGGFFFFSPLTVEWFCWHHTSGATCIEPKTCSRCGKTWGEPLGHTWQAATCTEPRTCTVCGVTDGSANGHSWQAATCTEPKTCTVCGMTDGEAAGHKWIEATCTTPKKCKNCGKIDGIALGHKIEDYICKRCGISVVSKNDVPDILDITLFQYDVNYVGGIDIYMTFFNKSSNKTINYITVELGFMNSVGDSLKDDISGKETTSLLFTGPLNSGKKSSKTYWRACFYNSAFSGKTQIKKIEIEYADGTKLVLDKGIARYAVKGWR